MFTNRIEHTTQIDQSWTVELKRRNGCSARRRQSEHVREVIVPGKMCFPALLARMKQPHDFSDGISNNHSLGFMLVAAVTAERQIVSRRRPAETAWYDVVNCEGICRVSRLRAAVFATMLAAISDQTAQLGRDVPFRHVQGNGAQADPSTPPG